MLERQGQLPGYTGHIPKFTVTDDFAPVPPKYYHIPNYQGFIPSVKAENIYGKTFARITESSALHTYNKGKDLSPNERYKSVAAESFTPQLRTPVMPFRPKKYPEAEVDPLEKVPKETVLNFFGSRGRSKIYVNSEKRANEDKRVEEGGDDFLRYEEARRLADQELKK